MKLREGESYNFGKVVVGKADLLSDHFDIKQSKESVDVPLTFLPSPRLSPLHSGRVSSDVIC